MVSKVRWRMSLVLAVNDLRRVDDVFYQPWQQRMFLVRTKNVLHFFPVVSLLRVKVFVQYRLTSSFKLRDKIKIRRNEKEKTKGQKDKKKWKQREAT